MAKRRSRKQLPVDIAPSAVAARMASRIPEGSTGLPTTLILTVLTTVLPLVLGKCFKDETPTDPAEVQMAVIDQHAANPDSLRRRTATAIIREAKASSQKRVSRADALVLADAAIAEVIESHADDVGAFCSFHM